MAGHEHITRVLLECGAAFMKHLPTRNRPTILHVASHDIAWEFTTPDLEATVLKAFELTRN
jgi:hypothetical protein